MEQTLTEMLDVLDSEVEALRGTAGALEAVTAAATARDMDAMAGALRQLGRLKQRHQELEGRRDGLRRRLAERLVLDPEEVTLDRLASMFTEARRGPLEDRRLRLLAAVTAVRRSAREAGLVVRQAARLNQALLEAVFPGATEVGTYSADGTTTALPAPELTNLEV